MPTGPGLYSRVVTILKVVLPLVALGLLASLFLIQTEDSLGGGIVFSRGDMAMLGDGLRISNPVFSGTSDADDAFRFTATTVIPDAAPPQRAQIETLAGSITFSDGPEVHVSADDGDLDIPARQIVLTGNVQISTADGYDMWAERVVLDMQAGTLQSDEEVETIGPLGRILSGELNIGSDEAGGASRRFSFGKGVRVIYEPGSVPN